MAATFLMLLAFVASAVGEEPGMCPAPIEAVMRTMPASPEWVGALVLDANADGVPEVFIADTDRGGNAGEPWRLYRRAQEDSYEVVGTVFFHPLGFKLENLRLETYWRLNAASGRFITYRLAADSIDEIERTELLSTEDAEFKKRWRAIAAWRTNLQDWYYSAQRQPPTEGEGERVICRSLR